MAGARKARMQDERSYTLTSRTPSEGETDREAVQNRARDVDAQHGDFPGRPLRMGAHLDQRHHDSPSLGVCIDAYLADIAEQVALGRRPYTTLTTYRSQARLISEDLRARPITAIRRADVKAWHNALAKRKGNDGRLLTGAADHALKTLRSVFRFADFEEIADLPSMPTRGISDLHKSRGARALAEAELEAWRNAIDVHEHSRTRRVRGLRMGHPKLVAAYTPTALLRLLDLTGARISEIRTLRVEHIHLELELLMLDSTKTDEGHARPLSRAAVVCIRQHLARLGNPTSGWMFPGRSRLGCIGDSQVTRVFRKVCEVAELKGATRRSLRTTLVSNSYRRRKSSAAIAAVCGHTKEMAFQRYRQALPGDAWDVAEDHARRRRAA